MTSRERAWWVGALVVTVLAYTPALGYPLIYDDGWTIVGNGFLREPDWGLLFSRQAVERHVVDPFRPAAVAFDVLTYRVLGLAAAAHHALSIGLHVGVAVAYERWLARLCVPTGVRLATLAVFGVLALHAQAVTLVSFREDLLAGLLGLAALFVVTPPKDSVEASAEATAEATAGSSSSTWVRGSPSAGALRYLAPLGRGLCAAGLMMVACACKQSAAALAGLWVVFRVGLPWRSRAGLGELAAGGLALALGIGLAFGHVASLYGSWSPYADDDARLLAAHVGRGSVLAESVRVHLEYLVQMVVPVGLSPEYVERPAAWSSPSVVLAAAALGSLFAYGVVQLVMGWNDPKRGLGPAVVVGAFVLALPTANLVPMPDLRADRFMYLPTLPVALGLAAAYVAARRRFPTLAVDLGATAFALVQVVALRTATSAYASESTLWEVAVRKAPGSARALAMQGLQELKAARAVATQGEAAELAPEAQARGLAGCRSALLADPREPLADLCEGRWLAALGRLAEADQAFSRALAKRPPRGHRIAVAAAELALELPGRDAEREARGIARADALVASYPFVADAYLVAGRIYHRLGRSAAAAEAYARASVLAPERSEGVAARVELALDLGDTPAATLLLADPVETLATLSPVAREALVARWRRSVALGLVASTPSSPSLSVPGASPP